MICMFMFIFFVCLVEMPGERGANENRWDKKTHDAAQEDRWKQEEEFRFDFRQKPTRERASMAEQAKALLSGKEGWKPPPKASLWEEDGEEVEVETDVELPKIER